MKARERLSLFKEKFTRKKNLVLPLKLPAKKRQYLNYFIIALLFVSLVGLIWSYSSPPKKEADYSTYYYLHEAALNYRIYFLPNNLFDDRIQGPGNAYITSLTDYILVDFDYHIFGDHEADIRGDYSAGAVLSAYTAQEEHLVWQREYELVKVNQFNQHGSDYAFRESFRVPFSEYQAFVEQVREETGFNPAELNLVINADVNLEIETGDGTVQDLLSTSMVIPMKGSTFTVGGQLIDEKEGGLTATTLVEAVTVVVGRIAFPIIIILSCLMLLITRFMTAAVGEKERSITDNVTGILKKHKERIVITANGVTEIPQGAITLYSFDELIKLADEVNKPILYPKPSSSKGSDHFFLVYTPEKVFAFGLETQTIKK